MVVMDFIVKISELISRSTKLSSHGGDRKVRHMKIKLAAPLILQASAKAASGWTVLVYAPLNAKLYNIVSDKHDTGVLWMATPLLVIDVYEHAYYLDYKNNKTEYIAKFMNHIDWGEVSRRYVSIG